MHIEVTIKNYRCFPDSHPLQFEIKDGFTAFIGTNNSGKSSVLKFFFEFRQLFEILQNLDTLIQLFNTAQLGFVPNRVRDRLSLFSFSNERDIEIEFRVSPPGSGRAAMVKCFLSRQSGHVYSPGLATVDRQIRSRPGLCTRNTPTSIMTEGEVLDFSDFVEAMRILHRSIYIGAFRNAINSGGSESYFDIEVGQAFVKAWNNYKTGEDTRANRMIKKVSDEIGSIFELPLEVNASPKDETLQVFVGGESYRLNELGAGLTQFIVVLANAAVKRPTLILIDEPELNLHPSLQLDFLTTLGSYAERGLLFSTHSLGLARASADRIYALRRFRQGESVTCDLERIPKYTEFLGELSFGGYQELGFDRILLVEGSTEVRTVQQFLRQLKAEHKIVLLPLGGSGMINGLREQELSEIKRISNDVSALIDSEKASASAELQKERADFVAACGRAGIACHVLHRRAIENYFTERAVKRIKGDKYRALGHFEKLESAAPHWAKSENWRIARAMDLDDLAGTDLLKFLESLRPKRESAATTASH